MMLEFDIIESVSNFITSPLSQFSVEYFLKSIGIEKYNLLYEPGNATHLVLVKSFSEYAFTSNDVEWLKYATEVYFYQCDSTYSFVFVNMDCFKKEYYYHCSAIVKIFNKAFPNPSIFLFKIGDSIAIGSPRSFTQCIHNNFTVSALISNQNIREYEDFLNNLSLINDVNDIPYEIMVNSPQEFGNDKIPERKKDYGYLTALNEFESFYGIDTSYERANYIADEEKDFSTLETYKEACDELSDIVEQQQISSYEALDIALDAEEKATQNYNLDIHAIENDTSEYDVVQTTFSKEAFENAETMLQEMLKNNNGKEE